MAFLYQVEVQPITSAIETLQHHANSSFFTILDRERVNNLLKADIYQYRDRNGTKLKPMYRIALLTEKILKALRN